MQFGHNDASVVNNPTRARGSLPGTGGETEAIVNLMTGEPEVVHTYGWYMHQMIAAAKAKGVRVVVCSPVPRNAWTGGKAVRSRDYQRWAADVAAKSGAAFVDLAERIGQRYDELGPERVKRFFPVDDTHTNREGAELSAAEAAAALAALRPHWRDRVGAGDAPF
jgi:lysophospholipase L1-like esterase